MDCLKNYAFLCDSFKKLYASMDSHIMDLEGISEKKLDPSRISEEYFKADVKDVTVDDNANHLQDGISFGNYASEVAKSNLKLIGYHDIYQLLLLEHGQETADKIMRSLWDGDLYVHDSTALQVPYCWALSIESILRRGNFWGQLQSYQPKRATSFIDQVKEVVIEVAQEIAGAVAISDLFIGYSYFVKLEHLDIQNPVHRKKIENDFQSLVHTLNKKMRPCHQSPFTNISIFDRPNLEVLFKDYTFPDGSHPDFDVIEEIQKIFCDWFHLGDPATGVPYRFPIVTLNLRVDEHGNVLDKKALEYFTDINLPKGCFNIYISSGNKIASCCRLTNDLDLAGADSFGNGGISLGSHRVVTINLTRLGTKAQSYNEFMDLLREQLSRAEKTLVAHRKLLYKRLDEGFLPFVRRGLIFMPRLFSTFGINGVYECVEQMGHSIMSEQGKQLAFSILQEIKDYATACSKKHGSPFNVEQVPAESLAIKLALKDKHLFNLDYNIYTNQFVPLWVDCDVVDRMRLDGAFSKVLTGGGISHLNFGERLTHRNQMKTLIECAIKYGCEHFAINYNYCRCENKHTTISTQTTLCPLCAGKIIEQYTRIVGYLTPVSSWNRGRREEHATRVFKTTDKQLDPSLFLSPETDQEHELQK
jgi:ribonucleoside-triphosphate reductase (formate)